MLHVLNITRKSILNVLSIFSKSNEVTLFFYKNIWKRLRGASIAEFPSPLPSIQWNLSIADMLYSGHLSIADTFPKNG